MNAKRGFLPEDEKNFSPSALETLRTASGHIEYLINNGYDLKQLIDDYLMFSRVRTPATLVKSKRGEKGSDTFFSFFDGIIPENKNGREIRNTDDLCIDAAVRFIRKRTDNKPFFMFVGLNFPHPPYQIEQTYYDLIDESKLQARIPNIADADGKPKMETGLRDALTVSAWDEERLRELRRTYLAMCAKVDAQAGRLVDALKRAGIFENTAIIVISDHGDYTGDYGIAEKCQNCFPDCLTNVPFIIKPPESIAADKGVREDLVELTDLCATVYDIAGIDCKRQSFSESLLPCVRDRSVPHREYVFYEGGRLSGETNCSEHNNLLSENDLYAPRILLQMKEDGTHTKAAMIRSKDYKYVLRLYEKDEFYVLSEGERFNRIDDEDYQPIITKMREELLLWYMRTCDIVPQSYDERFTAEFLQNNIASTGVPMFLAKAATAAMTLTGKPLSQVINAIRKKVGM